MAVTQDNIGPATRMGGTLLGSGGATFRIWAPRARDVQLQGSFSGIEHWVPDPSRRLVRDAHGYWAGFEPDAGEGDQYKFWIEGDGSAGFKRDPYARELSSAPAYPNSNCVLRGADTYSWRATGWRTTPFTYLSLYQLHIGTFHGPDRRSRVATFLDAALRLEYLADLGVTGIQLLPMVEFASPRSLGYDGSDIFSPEMDYTLEGAEALAYAPALDALLARIGQPPVDHVVLLTPINQFKLFVDLAHLLGMAVLLDVVYNHAGFQIGGQDESLWFLDRAAGTDPNDSLYFTDRTHTGPVFAFWRREVRQFLIDNALFFLDEYRIDGLRYDQTSVIDVENRGAGWQFLQDVTNTAHHLRPEAIQIAEYWPRNPTVTAPTSAGGAGFDATWSDELREALRGAIEQASRGADARVDLGRLAAALPEQGFSAPWRPVSYVESHDEIYVGREPRLARLADGGDPRSWYARTRARAALALVLCGPGIPMIFMGQEFLEAENWSDNPKFQTASLIDWGRLEVGDRAAVDTHRACRDLFWMRRNHRALREGGCRVSHVNQSARVLAMHRWTDNGDDIVVMFSLSEVAQFDYRIGLPFSGRWRELFNSDVYENWGNPNVIGNGGTVEAWSDQMHGFQASAAITLPPNSVIVLGR